MGKLGGVGSVAFVAAAALALTGCPEQSPFTAVSGRVEQSPGCGVVRPDEPVCPNRPVVGVVQARAADGTATTARTDRNGFYGLFLRPGAYTLVIDPDGDGPWPDCPDTPVTVARGVRQQVDIVCGSGIR